MTTMSDVFMPVDAPVASPYRFGLFSVATPTPDAESDWEGFGLTWVEAACAQPRITHDPCILGDTVDPLTLDSVCALVELDPFTVYHAVTGSMRNRDRDRAIAEARLTEIEQFGVEQQLWTNMAAAATEVAVTGAAVGLALAEQLLVEAYPAAGVLHMSRFTATLLADHLVREGARLTTTVGTPVVAGGGYDPVDGAAPTEVSIYGTGPLVLRRGRVDVDTQVASAVNGAATVAQRTYAVGWDCTAVGTTITLS